MRLGLIKMLADEVLRESAVIHQVQLSGLFDFSRHEIQMCNQQPHIKKRHLEKSLFLLRCQRDPFGAGVKNFCDDSG